MKPETALRFDRVAHVTFNVITVIGLLAFSLLVAAAVTIAIATQTGLLVWD